MLLNEFLKEHARVQAQETALAALQAANVEQAKTLKELAAAQKEQAVLLQKVSARVEEGEPARTLTAANPAP